MFLFLLIIIIKNKIIIPLKSYIKFIDEFNIWLFSSFFCVKELFPI